MSLQTVLEVCYLLPETNVGALVVSIVAIIGLILVKELNTYLGKRLPVPIPVELIAVRALTHTHTDKHAHTHTHTHTHT